MVWLVPVTRLQVGRCAKPCGCLFVCCVACESHSPFSAAGSSPCLFPKEKSCFTLCSFTPLRSLHWLCQSIQPAMVGQG